MTAYQELNRCISILNSTKGNEWAAKFVELKMDFFRKHQNGYVFSTAFGADFFTECLYWIDRSDYLPNNGECDRNFNAWLKLIRTEK